MAYILDLVVILIFALAIFLGFKKGFFKTIIGFAGLVAALVLAFAFSAVVANMAYDNFVEPTVEKALVESIGDVSDNALSAVQGSLDDFKDQLPAFFSDLMDKNDVKMDDILTDVQDDGEGLAASIASSVADKVLRPLAVGILRAVAFVLLFLILWLIAAVVGSIVAKIIKRSPFKGPDKLLGGVLGAVKGLILVLLAVTAMQLVAGFALEEDALITKETLEQSIVVSKIADINPLYPEEMDTVSNMAELF